MQQEHWDDASTKTVGLMLDGRARKTGLPRRSDEPTMLLVVNGYKDAVEFTLPEAKDRDRWHLLIDTNIPVLREPVTFECGHQYRVTDHSLLLFTSEFMEIPKNN